MQRANFANLVSRAAREVELAENTLKGEAFYLEQVAEGLLDESIHPDHLPVVGMRLMDIKSRVETALAQAEQCLYLAH